MALGSSNTSLMWTLNERLNLGCHWFFSINRKWHTKTFWQLPDFWLFPYLGCISNLPIPDLYITIYHLEYIFYLSILYILRAKHSIQSFIEWRVCSTHIIYITWRKKLYKIHKISLKTWSLYAICITDCTRLFKNLVMILLNMQILSIRF